MLLHGLLAARGLWRGTNRLHDPTTGAPADTPATAVVTPVVGGRFWRIAYTWIYQDRPQEGELFVGYQAEAGVATVHWADTWHTSDTVMACEGTAGDDGVVDVAGSYPAPSGPDWGWRIVVEPVGRESLRVVMHTVSPEGEVYPAVETTYEPA
ncbi:MAG TPA: DUF1579 family protein [Rubricoccaceae bacterium]|jgi:hypothetical protein